MKDRSSPRKTEGGKPRKLRPDGRGWGHESDPRAERDLEVTGRAGDFFPPKSRHDTATTRCGSEKSARIRGLRLSPLALPIGSHLSVFARGLSTGCLGDVWTVDPVVFAIRGRDRRSMPACLTSENPFACAPGDARQSSASNGLCPTNRHIITTTCGGRNPKTTTFGSSFTRL